MEADPTTMELLFVFLFVITMTYITVPHPKRRKRRHNYKWVGVAEDGTRHRWECQNCGAVISTKSDCFPKSWIVGCPSEEQTDES